MRWNPSSIVAVALGAALVSVPSPARAQSVAGAAILQIPLDVRSEGMGRAWEVLQTGPQAARANPGALGQLPGVQAWGMKVQLVPDLADDVRFRHGGVTVGVKPMARLPVRVVAGVNYTRLDYGESVITDPGSPDPAGTVEPFEDAVGATLALGFGEVFSVGAGIKQVTINFPNPDEPGELAATDVTATDFGLYARSPRMTLDLFNAPDPIGSVRFLGGMSWGNRGEPFHLAGLEERDPDPLPEVRRESVGMVLELLPASRAFTTSSGWIGRWLEDAHFLTFSGAVGREEAIDDARVAGTPNITNHRGYELNFLGLLSVRRGHLNDAGGGIVGDTFGWGISAFGYAGFDYARIPQYRELQTVNKWAFWVRIPVDALGG